MASMIGLITPCVFDFAPSGAYLCDGSMLSPTGIGPTGSPALFVVLGTSFGGDGITTFGLPDLRGSVAMGNGAGFGLTARTFGDRVGADSHNLTEPQLPIHSHDWLAVASTGSLKTDPSNSYLGGVTAFATASADGLFGTGTGPAGQDNDPHENRQPFLVVNNVIWAAEPDARYSIGEVRFGAFPVTPANWMVASGQSLLRASFPALFDVIGTSYGAVDGTHFSLPNFMGRVPVCAGQAPDLSGYVLGASGGFETVAIDISQMPIHAHTIQALGGRISNIGTPNGATLSSAASGVYAPLAAVPDQTLNAAAVVTAGAGTPHNNMMLTTTLNFIIAVQ